MWTTKSAWVLQQECQQKRLPTGNVDIALALNSLDGFTSIKGGSEVLLKDQETESENGAYVLDAFKTSKVGDRCVGSARFVENGDTNNDYIYHCLY